jgi:hypothetical protein
MSVIPAEFLIFVGKAWSFPLDSGVDVTDSDKQEFITIKG